MGEGRITITLTILLLSGIALGLLFGLVLLGHEAEIPRGYYPIIKLEYLYLRVYNVNSSVPSLANTTMLSYIAVIKVINTSNKTIVIKSITLAIPDNVILMRGEARGEESMVTMPVTVTISKYEPEKKKVWKGNDTIVVYDSSITRQVPAHGHTNSLLRSYGKVYYPIDDISYFILKGGFKRYIISGTVPLPSLWAKHMDKWLSGWTYVTIDAEGKVVDGKGYVEALLILKVKMKNVGLNEYYYGSLPEGFRFPET